MDLLRVWAALLITFGVPVIILSLMGGGAFLLLKKHAEHRPHTSSQESTDA